MNRDQFVFVIIVNAVVSAFISVIVVMIAFALTAPQGPATATAVAAASPAGGSTAAAAAPTSARRTQAVQYTVKSGDTLSSIAERYGIPVALLMQANGITNANLLAAGQTLTIPPADMTPQPAATIVPAAAAAPMLRITAILRPNNPPSPIGETVIIQNLGARLNMKGWSLVDLQGNLYPFPDLVLEPNASIRLHTETGLDTAADLYWDRTQSVWDANDTATLKDRNGVVMDSFTIRK